MAQPSGGRAGGLCVERVSACKPSFRPATPPRPAVERFEPAPTVLALRAILQVGPILLSAGSEPSSVATMVGSSYT